MFEHVEIFDFITDSGKRLLFNVEAAKSIVKDDRYVYQMTMEQMKESIERQKNEVGDYLQADVNIPGILAEYVDEEELSHILIDGNHRLHKCWDIGKRFPFKILSWDETKKIMGTVE